MNAVSGEDESGEGSRMKGRRIRKRVDRPRSTRPCMIAAILSEYNRDIFLRQSPMYSR